MRYLSNSDKVGHAVIRVITRDSQNNSIDSKNHSQKEIAEQYFPNFKPISPESDSDIVPVIRPLQNIESIERYGMKRYRASTPDGNTPMYATRYIDCIDTDGQEIRIACFSPTRNNKEPFWGSSEKEVPLYRKNLNKKSRKELEKEQKEIGIIYKGGNELEIESESVRVRDTIKSRNPDQNTVMGESAKDTYQTYLESMSDELSSDMKEVLKRAVDAPCNSSFKSNYRPEWLHAEGFGLTPMSKDPQNKGNLGAAGKWCNTEMMILERIAKWFALNSSNNVKIKPKFEMVSDSDLIKHIDFEVNISKENDKIKLYQFINPFKKHNIFRKASDLAQGTFIVHNLLNKTKPSHVQEIKIASANSIGFNINGRNTFVNVEKDVNQDKNIYNNNLNNIQINLDMSESKREFPTGQKFEKSLVQVYVTCQDEFYDQPWAGTSFGKCTGTGFVINRSGSKELFILTNAHVVENHVRCKVRLANSNIKYNAEPLTVCYQSDMALLKITADDFQKTAVSVQFGNMVNIQDKVTTIGFPIGGNEMSVTEGIVSRIEMGIYAMSGLPMLQVQVDSAINSGNSGGPIFHNNKVVGIAFQGINAQNIGYMIPIPMINHFLKECWSENYLSDIELHNVKKYKGFPELPIYIQPLENKNLRTYYGMGDNTGVRISKVDTLSDAFEKLKVNDILIEIDNLKISNQGKVDYPGIGNRIDYDFITHMKYINDIVKVKVIRENTDIPGNINDFGNRSFSDITLNIKLDHIPLKTKMIAPTEYDKPPTFYFASGILFQPLTRNYLETPAGSDLSDASFPGIGTIYDICKEKATDHFVIINTVLDSDETEGYEDYSNEFVTEINGCKINYIHDVMEAIEGNKNEFHCISLKTNEKIVVKNMSISENQEILSKHRIKFDRSIDLKAAERANRKEERKIEKVKEKIYRVEKKVEIKDMSDDEKSLKNSKRISKYAIGTNQKEKKNNRRTLTPGQKNYFKKVNELEEKYKNKKNNSDSEVDFSKLSAESESDDIEDSESEDITEKMRSRRKEKNENIKEKKERPNKRKVIKVLDSDSEDVPLFKKLRK